MDKSSLGRKWSFLEKLGFRFSFIYFLLFIVFKNNGAYPFWDTIMKYPKELLHKFIPWVGKNILKLSKDITIFTNGSGDTTYDYVVLLLIFSIAVLGALLWSLVDRKIYNYSKLYYWITVAIRFYVGLMLINYGLVKVIKLQFSYPGFYRLIEPYGSSSPMGLAWTFLGFSKGYNLFMGIAEITAILLLFRRTMTAGAVITLMTAANVMAVNYFYDVPVKILSTHLVIMILFLLLRDFKALFIFFFTGRAVRLFKIKQPTEFKGIPLRIVSRALKGVFLIIILIYGVVDALGMQKQYGERAPKPAIHGLFEITHFVKNGDTLAADITSNERWRYLILERKGRIQIQKMDNTKLYFKSNIDTVKHKISVTGYRDSTDTFSIDYKKTDSTFRLKTIFKKDTIQAKGIIKQKEDFLLLNRGFHWISEYPFNR